MDNKKVVSLLKQAKKVLAIDASEIKFGRQRFICHAITRADENNGYSVEATYLRALIMERLDGATTLDGWLADRGFDAVGLVVNTKTQLTRHAWVDSLIEEHS